MIYDLIPVWVTPATRLDQLLETDELAFQLQAHEEVRVAAAAGLSSVQLRYGANRVTRIEADGEALTFTRANDTLVFAPLSQAAQLVITTAAPVFSLLNGNLPPGLQLGADGTISGRVGNLAAATSYEFTVRIGNEQHTRDRVFSYDVQPFYYAGFYNPVTMAGTIDDATTGLSYHPLGVQQRGAPLAMTLDILDPDGIKPPTTIRNVTGLDPANDALFGVLPQGLRLDGICLTGYIAADAPIGRYFFQIVVTDTLAATLNTYVFMIEVAADVAASVAVMPVLTWQTPAGLLGTVYEGRSCFYGVQALAIGGPAPVYSLAIGSGSLPPGLRLDAATGLIVGRVGDIARDTDYTFTVRATSGLLFVERDFTLHVPAVFNAIPHYDVRLQLSLLDQFALMLPYRAAIPTTALYRPSDPTYGFSGSNVYVIRGLDGRQSLTNAVQDQTGFNHGIGPLGYHRSLELILGEHRVAVAKRSDGVVVYEVLYRPLYDPQALAGGFRFDSPSTPVADPVFYPQHIDQQMWPCSLRNERLDLVAKLGMATDDPAKRYLLGAAGIESMPRWMVSPQSDDPNSALGFLPAVVIAFLLPGTGPALLNSLTRYPLIANAGKVYRFNRYYISGQGPDHVQL